MPYKCCVGNCNSNYKSHGAAYIPMYSFPKDNTEKERWLAALPNIIESPGPHTRICALHWPDDAAKEKSYKSRHEVAHFICFFSI